MLASEMPYMLAHKGCTHALKNCTGNVEEACLNSSAKVYKTRRYHHGLACLFFAIPAMISTGCGHQNSISDTQATQTAATQTRLEEVERTNGRLSVRVEELERQLLLVQDRIEATRLSMQRRNNGALAYGEAPAARPQPVPESYYGHNDAYSAATAASPAQQQRAKRRPVARISLSDEQSGLLDAPGQGSVSAPAENYVVEKQLEDDGEELVITDADFRAFAGIEYRPSAGGSGGSTTSSAPTAVSSSGKVAQPPVTSERLSTSQELKSQENPAEKPSNQQAAPAKGDLLGLYQDSLAKYRAGSYAEAMVGFQSFLDAGPRPDYIDNALYWIGECHYGLGDYSRAVSYFQRILDEIPNGGKAADAMLKMSLAYDRMGQGAEAVVLLTKLSNQHPTTNSGKLAAKRLEEHPERQ